MTNQVFSMRAVDVNVTCKGVHLPAPIDAGLISLQPQDAAEYPVALKVASFSLEYPHGLARSKNRSDGLAITDHGSNAMSAQRCFEAVS